MTYQETETSLVKGLGIDDEKVFSLSTDSILYLSIATL